MQYGSIASVTKPVSRLVQGTVMLSTNQQEHNATLLDAVWDAGITTFDTAHGYGQGDCERAFADWLHHRGLRDKAVVIGKGAHHNQDRQRVTPFDISADLHDSLARMRLDYIDLYVLHRDNPAVLVGPIIDTLAGYQRQGMIHAYGVSNWSTERIAEALAYASDHELPPPVASSPNFSLAAQRVPPWPNCVTISGPEHAADREWYAAHAMPLLTWSSLAGGFFSGRFRRDNLGQFDGYLDKLCVDSYCTEENFQRLDRAEQLAEAKRASLPQIALAYVLSQGLDVFALVGCATPAEVQANAAAVAMRLSDAECAWLDLRADAPA